MKIRPLGVIVFAATLVGSLLVGQLPTALAQIPDTVDFAIADSDIIYPSGNPPNDPGDVVVLTGKPLGVTDAGSCGPVRGDLYPVYNVVVIDPGFGNRATRFTNVFVVASTNPVRPGTKLGNITGVTACGVGTTSYVKYRGTVQ